MTIRVRLLVGAILALIALDSFSVVPSAASQRRSGIFGSICIFASDLSDEAGALVLKDRNDLAERVSLSVRARVNAVLPGTSRRVAAPPNCIHSSESGFDRELKLLLSVKRQKINLAGRDWNIVIASGTSLDGLYADREVQPVVLIKQEAISDDAVVTALIEFLDRTIVEELRQK